MSDRIPITMLLQPGARNAGDIARVQQIASELGLVPASTGRTSLTFRISPERFAELFGVPPQPRAPRPPGPDDQGTPGGFDEATLPIPAALAPYVDSIAVVPPATRLR